MAEATLALRKACKTASSCEGFGGLLVKGLAIKIFSRRKTIVELLSSVQRNTLFSTLCFAHFGGRRSTNFGLKAAIVFVSLPNEDAPHDVSVEVRLITAVKTPYQADGKIDLEVCVHGGSCYHILMIFSLLKKDKRGQLHFGLTVNTKPSSTGQWDFRPLTNWWSTRSPMELHPWMPVLSHVPARLGRCTTIVVDLIPSNSSLLPWKRQA